MKVLREVNGVELNEGDQMAKGLFNVSNDTDVSIWFDEEEKDWLIGLSDDEFLEEANSLIKL